MMRQEERRGQPPFMRVRPIVRWSLRLLAVVLLLILALVALIYFRQHAMIYHPRPYDASYTNSFPPDGVEIHYNLPAGAQTAYFIPGAEPVPKRLWLAFCGNGSLALDWMSTLQSYPRNGDAFLLVDYPGYGRNAGYATIDGMRSSVEEALRTLLDHLHLDGDQVRLCVIGHSLGAAVAFDFAAHHRIERLVAIAPFTSLREEAACVVGGPLSHLLIENYDNRAAITKILRENRGARIAVFHGVDDEVIPVRMGKELSREFPEVEFFPISGGDHVSVLQLGREQIIAWMNQE
jgi:uncharacterized protein